MTDRELLENILASQILILAKLEKVESKSKGVSSTSDFTREAATEISKQAPRLLKLLEEKIHHSQP